MRDAQDSQQQALTGLGELYGGGATTQELYQYGLDNPGVFERVNQTIGFKNDQTKQLMQDTLISALQNPEQRDQIITQGAESIKAAGGNPQYLSQAIGNDSEGFERGAVPFLASLGGQGANFAKTYMGMKPQAPVAMTEAQSEANQRAIERNDLAKLQLQQKTLENQYRRETDELKRNELEQKIEQTKVKSNEAKQKDKEGMDSAYSGVMDTLNLVDAIEGHEGFSGAVGWQAAFPTVPGSDSAGVEGMIETLSSQNFLNSVQNMKGMGALSDAEGKKLSSAVASLNPDMSENDFKKALNVIRGITKRAKSKLESKYKGKGYKKPSIDNVYQGKEQGGQPGTDYQTIGNYRVRVK